MPFKLRPATKDDCIQIAHLEPKAFPELSAILFPAHLKTEEKQDDEIAWRVGGSLDYLRDGLPTVVMVETADDDSGQELRVVGVSSWDRPRVDDGRAESLSEIDDMVAEPSGLDESAIAEISRVIDDQEKRFLGESAADTWTKL
ncbi:hypothetical protein V8F33_006838 [Rhypophila sp. PSN 637]